MSSRKKKSKKKKTKSTDYLIKLIAVSSIFVSLIAVCYYFYSKQKAVTYFDVEKFTIRGVDLSHHNPIIDWDKIDGHDINFVYLKATGGTSHLDRNYLYNYQAAKNNKIRVGSYHFYLFGVAGKEQARHFIETATCETGDLLPAIDVEHSPDNPCSKDSAYVNLVINELKILENELYEHYAVRPIIYTNKDCYKRYIKDNFADNLIWMCDLQAEPSDVDNWIIWQFSHTGSLPDVKGKIDLNYFRHTFDQFSKIIMP